MLTFAWYFSVAFIAATLIVSGAGHVIGFARFVTTIRSHGLVPVRYAIGVAALVTVFEVAGGGLALAVLGLNDSTTLGAITFAACTVMGVAFLLYIRLLLKRPHTVASCGCSPLPSAVTPASLAPSAGLTATSCLGLAASALGAPTLLRLAALPEFILLAVGWGVTLAGIVLVYPATVPASGREGGR
jgi:hypothetical protein